MGLEVGQKAPAFALSDKDGNRHTLSGVRGKYTVVYFYPKDSTPGCTVEAIEFTAQLAAFDKAGASIVGISGGDDRSKKKFCEKQKPKVLLLSDTDFAVASSYGCYGTKKFMGRSFNGIYRRSFLLDAAKRIVKVYPEVTAKGHAEQVLRDIKELEGFEAVKRRAAPLATVRKTDSAVKRAVSPRTKVNSKRSK